MGSCLLCFHSALDLVSFVIMMKGKCCEEGLMVTGVWLVTSHRQRGIIPIGSELGTFNPFLLRKLFGSYVLEVLEPEVSKVLGAQLSPQTW